MGVVEEDERQTTITISISISANVMDCGQRTAAKRDRSGTD